MSNSPPEETEGANGSEEPGANSWNWQATVISMCAAAALTECHDVVIAEVLEGIKSGRWREPVEQVRRAYARAYETAVKEANPDPYKVAKDAVNSLKKRLPGVTPSGRFPMRASTRILVHSGILCIDVDNLEDPASLREELKSDAHVLTAFVSPSGRGLKVWVRIHPDATLHRASFLAARRHFRETHGVEIDGDCKDLARLCFVSHDEDIFIRAQEATLLDPLPPEKTEPTPPPPVRDIDAELTAKCGPAFYLTKNGAVVINQSYFVQRICRENLVFFDYDENRSFRYNVETGTWQAIPVGIIKELVRSEWERFTRLFKEPALAFKDNASLINAITAGIESHSGRNKVFKRLRNIIHCANGMLHISDDGTWRLMLFSPGYYARNPIPIPWDPDATCPKFDALLEFALPAVDVSLFWRWFGSVLLTGNAAQRILLCIGKAATAKSTIAEVVELVCGLTNCTALRTKLLHERFEIGRLFGFSLLSAKDVPGRFLGEDGAQALKKLVGHDYIPGEVKGSMVSVPVYGDFDCMITCNERLLVRLEGETDVQAWRRRLMVLEFLNVIPVEKRIDNYAQILFAEEAPGILRGAVAGAIAHLAELKARGNFAETATQKARVDHLLAESESVRYFVAERVYRVPGGAGLSTEELVSAYIDYCTDRNWRPYGIKQVERALPDIMMSIHGVHVGAHIMRDGKRGRGYPHVALAQPDEPEDGEQAWTNDEETQGEF